MNCGEEPGEQSGSRANKEGKKESRSIETNGSRDGQMHRREFHDRVKRKLRNQDTDCASQNGETHAFGEKLAHEANAGCTDSLANGHFAGASDGADCWAAL